jgi:hypothetical protein
MCQTLAAFDPTGNQGDLRAGAIIPDRTQPVTAPVTGIVGNNRFVYFSWNNYDSESTGLGRLDLENFIDALTPTYSSDLMIPGQGGIYLEWDPITNGPLMALQGPNGGVWTIDSDSFVDVGTVDSGYIVYDIPDNKVAMNLVGQVLTNVGTVSGFVSVDQPLQQNYRLAGTVQAEDPATFSWPLPEIRGGQFQVQFKLTPSDDLSKSPTLSNWTLKAFPGVSTGIEISVVLIMSRQVLEKDLIRPFDPYEEYDYLENLRQNQQVIQYVEGPFVRDVIITSLDWLPNLEQYGGAYSGYNSYLIVYCETLPT